MVTSLEPFFQLVSKRVVPGFGPRERNSGNSSTMPMAVEPARKRPPSSRLRLTTMPPRWVMAAVIASRSASVEWNSCRSSTKGPWGIRYLPQAVTPKPRPRRPTPRVMASHWVLATTQ